MYENVIFIAKVQMFPLEVSSSNTWTSKLLFGTFIYFTL